jgi:hypothetical protein
MAKLKAQATRASDLSTTRDKHIATSRPRGISRVFAAGHTFLPIAPGDSDDSDLEGQAEERRIQRAQSAPAEQQRYAQEQSRRDQVMQQRFVALQGQKEQLHNGQLGMIEEEDEDGDENEDEDEDEDDEENVKCEDDDDDSKEDGEDNGEGSDGLDAEQDAESNHQFNLADLLEDEEETVIYGCDNSPAIDNMSDSSSGGMEVVDNNLRKMLDKFRAVSVSDTNNTSTRTPAATQAQ